jgi:hypothetical protein
MSERPKQPGFFSKLSDSMGYGNRWEKEYDYVMSLSDEEVKKEADEERKKVGILPEPTSTIPKNPDTATIVPTLDATRGALQKRREELIEEINVINAELAPKVATVAPSPETTALLTHESTVEKRSWLETVESFTTARGSKYTVLPDGKIQRYKTNGYEVIDGDKQKEPFELMVFFPEWSFIVNNAPPEVFKALGNTKETFKANFSSKFTGRVNGYKGYIVNQAGQKLRTTQEVLATEGIVWAVILKEGEQTPYVQIPVEKQPLIGRSTLEMNRIFEHDGSHSTNRHVGNEIISIKTKS